MSRRTEKVASTVHKELAQIMLRELVDPRLVGLPSITLVKVSEDLSIADVFITVMGTPGQQTAALNALKHAASLMRVKLTKQMTLRIAPFLKFGSDRFQLFTCTLLCLFSCAHQLPASTGAPDSFQAFHPPDIEDTFV